MKVANVTLCALAIGGGVTASGQNTGLPAPSTHSHSQADKPAASEEKTSVAEPLATSKPLLPSLPTLTTEQKERLGCAVSEVTPALKRALVQAQAEGAKFMVADCQRGKAEEEKTWREGKSKIRWPDSAHNVADPSIGAMAVDIYPLDPSKSGDIKAYEKQARIVQKIAEEQGIDIDWGGDWKSLKDGPHLEIKDYKELREKLSEQNKNGNLSADELTLAVVKLQGNALPNGASRNASASPPPTPSASSMPKSGGRSHS